MSVTAAPEERPEEPWTFSLAVSTYVIANERSYVQPTLTADRGRLHLEGRYNYEALDAASVWVGYKFAGGGGETGGGDEKPAWELTPILGGVFGGSSGPAAGYRGILGWRNFELFSEGEFVFDANDSPDSFFYSWSELTVSPAEWLRLGLAAQRTRTDDADHDFQPGLVAGVSFERLALSAYVFDSHEGKPTWVFALSLSF